MNLIALAIPVFFLLIGVEWVVARAMGLRVYRFNDAITDLSCGISQQVTGVFLKAVALLPYIWVYEHGRLASLSGSAWTTHLLAFLGVDLGYYLWHRWTHEMNLGWTTHVVHHQSEDYNLAVALRQSITSSLSSWPFVLPLALLGVPPVVVFTHSALNTLYQFWIHTETVRKLGPLEWVLNTPSHHRVHHAINPRYIDRNYAGVLIVWDRLFGSFEPESEPPIYGTVEPMRSLNPLWANVWYFEGLVRDSLAAPRWADKVRVWFARPGWRPRGLDPYVKVVPASREEQQKYDPIGSPGVYGYVAAWFVPVAVTTTGMLLVEDTAPPALLAVAMVLVLWTVASWGASFEQRPYAHALELGRLAAIAVVGAFAVGWGAVGLGAALIAGATASAGWWFVRVPRPAGATGGY